MISNKLQDINKIVQYVKEQYKSEFKTHKLNSGKSTNKKSIQKKTKLAQL